MDISLGLTQSLGPKVPMCLKQKPRFSRKNSLKINVISCRASNALATEIGTHSNFYEVLSLGSGDVGFDEIKKAYRRLALQWHPDLSPSSKKEESTKKFVEIQKAYETLSDPSTRSRYDRQLNLGSSFDVDMGWAPSNEAKFCKAVWENQLDGLHRRSHDRMTMKNYNRFM